MIRFKSDKNGLSKSVHIGDYTITIPIGSPVGISKKHKDDERCKVIGDSISLSRMITDAHDKGLI